MLKSQENCLLLKTNIDKTKAAFIIILSVTKVQKRCVMAEEENQREADEERMIRLSAPAVLDDELVVTCRVTELKGASATMHQEVLRGDQLLVSIDVKVAYLSLKTKRPTRVPKELAAKIEQYL